MKKFLINGFIFLALSASSQNANALPAKKSTSPQETELKLNGQTIGQKSSANASINSDAVPNAAIRQERPDTTLQLIITYPDNTKISNEPKKTESKSSPK
jgi:hypothetical protein